MKVASIGGLFSIWQHTSPEALDCTLVLLLLLLVVETPQYRGISSVTQFRMR